MTRKKNRFQQILVSSFLLFSSMGVAKPAGRKIAQQLDGEFHEIILSYGNDANAFRKLRIHLSTSDPYISFQSFGDQEYVLDCQKIASERDWNCFSSCDGGSLKITFSKATGFKEIEIPPFQITPRLCDGSESDEDPKLTSRKTLKFSLIGIDPKLPESQNRTQRKK